MARWPIDYNEITAPADGDFVGGYDIDSPALIKQGRFTLSRLRDFFLNGLTAASYVFGNGLRLGTNSKVLNQVTSSSLSASGWYTIAEFGTDQNFVGSANFDCVFGLGSLSCRVAYANSDVTKTYENTTISITKRGYSGTGFGTTDSPLSFRIAKSDTIDNAGAKLQVQLNVVTAGVLTTTLSANAAKSTVEGWELVDTPTLEDTPTLPDGGTSATFLIAKEELNDITANTAKVSFPEAPNDGNIYARRNQAWTSSLGDPLGSIREHAFSGDTELTSNGWLQFAYDNAVSQTTYSDFWNKTGHMFNQQHVDAGDTDLSGSSTMFYPTPVPENYGRVGIPNLEFSDSDVDISTNRINNLPSWMDNTNRRDGMKVRLVLVSGTLPGGLSETEYYIGVRGISGSIILSTTEQGAIDGSTEVNITSTGSGNFRLTQQGVALETAIIGHHHNSAGSGGSGGTTFPIIDGGSSGRASNDYVTDPSSDGEHGTPVITNETRPSTYYKYSYIKALIT